MRALQRTLVLACIVLMGTLALPAFGQAGGGGGNGGGGFGGGQGGGGFGGGQGGGRRGGGFGQQQMMDRIKTALQASDDEFTAIQPKIEKVMQLQQDAGTNGRGMRGLFGGGGAAGGGRRGGGQGGGGFGNPAGGTTTPSAVQTAMTDLQQTLDNTSSTPDQIKVKLDALRQAKAKAKEDLTAAQGDLKSLLTQRQEAQLVIFGMLE